MAENRTPRTQETRSESVRTPKWKRPETLPMPNEIPGWVFRWVRISSMGQADPSNTSSKLREGWEACRLKDHPEMESAIMVIENSRFKDNIVIGGLMLCKAPTEMIDERTAYYSQSTRAQMETVDQNLMREQDARMPMFGERKSKVTFGKGE